MIAWLRHHRASFALTLSRLAHAPAATLLNVLVVGIALALPLGGYCILVNVQTFAKNVATEPQISVFLAADATRNDVAGIEDRIRTAQGVKALRFVPRDSALTALKRDPGMAEMIATLRNNPLPDAFVVSLSGNDAQIADRLERQFRALPKVTHVQVDSAWVQRLDALLALGRTAVTLLAVLLSFALVAVTFNTIRLQILTHGEEIEVSRLIGATDAYIRRPFFYLGSLLGALGGVAALGIVFTAFVMLNRDLAPLAALYGSSYELGFPGLPESATVLGLAAGLGWLGAFMSVSVHLRALIDS